MLWRVCFSAKIDAVVRVPFYVCVLHVGGTGFVYRGSRREKALRMRSHTSSFPAQNFGYGEVVGITADMNRRVLTFEVNGQVIKQDTTGDPFEIELPSQGAPWFPAISMADYRCRSQCILTFAG